MSEETTKIITVIVLIAVFSAVGMAIFTYVIFPNFDGLAQNITVLNYNEEVKHYLYWSIVWIFALLAVLVGRKLT
jgi:glucan phosphoethanolaminetransferase (alkaline phosphatase superfamily)